MNQPGYPTYPMGMPPRTPGTIITVRVLGWIQVGLAGVSTVLAIIGAVVVASAVNDVNRYTDSAFSGFGTLAIGLVVVLVIVFAALTIAVAVPLMLLKFGRMGAGIGLIVVESIFVVLDLIALGSSGSPKAVIVTAMLVSIAIITLLVVPPSREWLGGRAAAPRAFSAPGPAATWPQQGQATPFPSSGGWAAAPLDGRPDTSSVPVIEAAAPSAGQWLPDPSGRHTHRYHDGTAWTDWISTNGVAGRDSV